MRGVESYKEIFNYYLYRTGMLRKRRFDVNQ